jgi:hypothetical protein
MEKPYVYLNRRAATVGGPDRVDGPEVRQQGSLGRS